MTKEDGVRNMAPVFHWYRWANQIVATWFQKLVFLLGIFGVVVISSGKPMALAQSRWTFPVFFSLVVLDYGARALREWKKKLPSRAAWHIDYGLRPALKRSIGQFDTLLSNSNSNSFGMLIMEILREESLASEHRNALFLLRDSITAVWWDSVRVNVQRALASYDKEDWERAIASLDSFFCLLFDNIQRLTQEFPSVEGRVRCSGAINDVAKPLIRTIRELNSEKLVLHNMKRDGI